MNKIKRILKYVTVLFYFAMMGIMAIVLLTGAFRFAAAFIENRSPDPLDVIAIITVGLILGCIGLIYFIFDEDEDKT